MKTVSMLPIETAHLLSSRLEQAGITAIVQDEEGGALLPGAGLSRARIQVDEADFDAAKEIARDFESEEAGEDEA